MKKLLFVLLVSTLVFISCNNDDMDKDNQGEKYLTITYHSEGHTSGEPPIDEKKYKPYVLNEMTFTYDFVDSFIIPDQGSMIKEGHYLIGWKPRDPISISPENNRISDNNGELYVYPGGIYSIGKRAWIFRDVDFDAVWAESR